MIKSNYFVYSLVFLLLIFSCTAKKHMEAEDLIKVEKAEESDYITGANGDRGKIFSMFVAANKEEVQFDSLWVDGKRLKLSQVKKDAQHFVVEASYVNREEERTMVEEKQKEENCSFPVSYNGKAIASYVYKGEKKYLLVASFEKVQSQGEEVK